MLPSDRKQFSTVEGKMSSDTFPEVKPLPAGWEWDGDWFVDTSGSKNSRKLRDEQGWMYAVDFDWFKKAPFPGEGECTSLHYVRRRRWVRRRHNTQGSRVPKGSALKPTNSPAHPYGPPPRPSPRGGMAAFLPKELSGGAGFAQSGSSGNVSIPGQLLVMISRVVVGLVAYPMRWLAKEQCAMTLTGGNRIVLQNVHMLLAVFWLLCGFVIGEVMASWNEKLLMDRFLQ